MPALNAEECTVHQTSKCSFGACSHAVKKEKSDGWSAWRLTN